MGKERLELSDTPLQEQRFWESDGITTLRATVTLPRCGGEGARARRFDRYYAQYARAYFAYCEGELLPRAAAELHAAMERSAPWQCAQAELTYRVSFEQDGVLSIVSESRERELRGALCLRRAETWDMEEAYLLPLETFFPPRTPLRQHLTAAAIGQISKHLGGELPCSALRRTLRRGFNSRSFYLAPDGLHWFYQQSTESRNVDFCLPWMESGPFLAARG